MSMWEERWVTQPASPLRVLTHVIGFEWKIGSAPPSVSVPQVSVNASEKTGIGSSLTNSENMCVE
jgi:hypothetical protein